MLVPKLPKLNRHRNKSGLQYTSCVAVWKKLRSKSYIIINNEPSDKKTSLSSLTAFKDTHDQVSTSHEKKLR